MKENKLDKVMDILDGAYTICYGLTIIVGIVWLICVVLGI